MNEERYFMNDDDHPQYLDAGYVYAPYVPQLQTPVVLNPDEFSPREGILTRYGRRLLEEGSHFYATITVGDVRDVPRKVNWLKEGF